VRKHNLRGAALIAMLALLFAAQAFSEAAESSQFVGKKICREAQGPDDTTSFNITLMKDGTLQGSGSFSGATANFSYSSGTWKAVEDAIEMILVFSGKQYGPSGIQDGTKTIKIKVQKFDLMNDSSECYAFEGRI
jgi:hypothetical protein